MNRSFALLCVICVGCAHDAPPSTDSNKAAGFFGPVASERSANTPAVEANHSRLDAQPDVPVIINLSIYHLAVPRWSISSDSNFWKHVDENRIDVDVKDLMQFNGFRVGLAPRSDWEYFKPIFQEQQVISQRSSGTAVNSSSAMEIPFRQNIDQQYIAWYDPSYQLSGQTFGACDNFMVIHFEPVRRMPGTVRVKITPMVRAQQYEVRYTALERPNEWPMVRPQYLWEVLSQIDIPVDDFLVIAPTPDRNDGPTLGHRFLLADGPGQPAEHLLLISPQPFRFEKPAPATQPASKPVH